MSVFMLLSAAALFGFASMFSLVVFVDFIEDVACRHDFEPA